MKSQPSIRNPKHNRGRPGRSHLRRDELTPSKAGLQNRRISARILISALVLFTILSGTCWSIRNSTVGNPIGSATTPPSSLRSGLIRSPNPIDTSFNDVVTGNVRGGKHFRGGIPYRSPTNFWTGLGSFPSDKFMGSGIGSSALDSFLRDSAGSDNFGSYTRKQMSRPFYSPSNSVSATQPGRPGVFKPTTTRIDGRVTARPDSTVSLKQPTMPIIKASPSEAGLQPMLIHTPGVEQMAPGKVGTYPKDGNLRADEYIKQMEQLRNHLEQIRSRAAELGQKLADKDETLQPLPTVELSNRIQQPFETQQIPKEQTTTTAKPEVTTPPRKRDIYEQIKEQLDKLPSSEADLETEKDKSPLAPQKDAYGIELKGFGQLPATQQTEASRTLKAWDTPILQKLTEQQFAHTKTTERKEEPSRTQRQDSYRRRSTAWDMFGTPLAEQKLSPVSTTTKRQVWSIEEVDKLSSEELSAKAKRIMGPHESYDSFAEGKFNQHIQAADLYLKQGRYYRAANAYTLASIYKSNDPLVQAGKAHALFAAGEYMSSALFLSRAIEAMPEYAKYKVDLAAVLGDKDKIESRIADIEEWSEGSKTAELHFLLGYVYYRMGRLDKAKEAIDTAYIKMPQSQAVGAVKKAIYDAIK